MSDLTVIVLAAGGGTRMKSKTMKVLHPIGGRSMIGHVLHAVRGLQPTRIVAVVGTQREQVTAHIAAHDPDVAFAVQETQDGTGHAVRIAMDTLGPVEGTVLVAYGDTPLLRTESLRIFLDQHAGSGAVMSVLSGELADAGGYGRVIRNAEGELDRIVEHKDATEDERRVGEFNSGIAAYDAGFLAEVLPRIGNANAGGEYYLTDAVGLARADGHRVGVFKIDDVTETEGANDRAQLATLARKFNDRVLAEWMAAGVTVVDPASTWIDSDVTLAADVTLLPGVQLLGATSVAEDAVIGPDSTLKDCEVGAGARVVRTHAELAVIGPEANTGPFAYLRPGATLGRGAKAGAFVEIKNADLGEGAKVPHLSYIGDASIGEGSNIGAGSITANYDGVAKHRTVVGKHCRTGSDNVFVAPVTIGDGAVTGAGSTIRRDVPPGALAVTGGQQRHLEGWVFRKRPGTAAALAAEATVSGGGTGGGHSGSGERQSAPAHPEPAGGADA